MGKGFGNNFHRKFRIRIHGFDGQKLEKNNFHGFLFFFNCNFLYSKATQERMPSDKLTKVSFFQKLPRYKVNILPPYRKGELLRGDYYELLNGKTL
jgi:hypothetical protein